jgi:hypothetical protein
MGSFAEAKECVDRYGKENVLCLFADTLMEDEDLYRFLKEIIEFLGCELVTLCYGKTPWELFEAKRFVANSRVDLCSSLLKRDLLNNWVGETFGYDSTEQVFRRDGTPCVTSDGEPLMQTIRRINAEVHLGIDFSEEHRLKKTKEIMSPWVYRSTLVEDGKIIHKDYSEQFGIRKPRLYSMGFGHNNCGGFCVKAGLGHFKILYEQMPERYKEHEDTEVRLAETVGTLPFLKKTIDGKVHYLTLRAYREQYLEAGKAEEDKFDIGGCACAI